jgi:hypothetical protein
MAKSILRVALLFGFFYSLLGASLAHAQIAWDNVREVRTDDMSEVDLYLINFDNRLDFRIPKAFMDYADNWRGDSQTFIRLGLSLSKLIEINENSAVAFNLSMARPLTREDFIEILIQVPARKGGIDKVFEYDQIEFKFTLVETDLFGLESYKVGTGEVYDQQIVWLRPLDKQKYSDIYFKSLRGLDRKFPYTENMVVDSHVRAAATYSASHIDQWRDVDSAVRKLIRRLIIKVE